MVYAPREACSEVNRTTSFVLVGRVVLHMHGMYPFEDAHDCFFGCTHTILGSFVLKEPSQTGLKDVGFLRRAR